MFDCVVFCWQTRDITKESLSLSRTSGFGSNIFSRDSEIIFSSLFVS